MGLFDKLFSKGETAVEVAAEPGTLYLPIEGEVIPLIEIGDGAFSEGILGQGCGIQPADETVYAPADGTITQIADTKHAIGMESDDGIEILIHVGMDTVAMNGDGFTVLVMNGQKVKCGQPMLKFSASKIKAAGYPTTTAFVVTNTDDLSDVSVFSTGKAEKLTPVIRVEK